MEKLFSTTKQIAKSGWLEKRCSWCGQHFVTNDELMLVIVSTDFKKKYKRLAYNYLIHANEFNELMEHCNNDEELFLIKCGEHPTPRAKNKDMLIDKSIVDAFSQTAKEFGMRIKTETSTQLKYRRSGSSLQIVLNLFTGKVNVTAKGNRSIMSRLYLCEFGVKVSNRVNELLGKDERNEFNAEFIVKEAVQQTMDIFNK